MKNKKTFYLLALSLVLGILFLINRQLENLIIQYQEAFESGMKLAQKEEVLKYNWLEKQFAGSNIDLSIIDSLRKQQDFDDFQSLLSQNKESLLLQGFHSSLHNVYDSLALDYAKIELWHYLARKNQNQKHFMAKK